VLVFALAVLAGLAAPALAQSRDVEYEPVPGPGGSLTDGNGGDVWGWLKMLGGLGLIAGGAYAVKRFAVRRWRPMGTSPRANETMKVIGRSPLAPRQELVLVKLGRRVVMVASGPDGSRTLSEVTDPAEVAELLAAMGQSPGDAADNGSPEPRQMSAGGATGPDWPGEQTEAGRLSEMTRKLRARLAPTERR
jgi:flagellar biogenesis protein FliO